MSRLLMGIPILLIGFTGCSRTIVEYVPQTVIKEVPVPVILDIPTIDCELGGDTPDEIINNMLKCIIDQKKVLDILRSENNKFSKGK